MNIRSARRWRVNGAAARCYWDTYRRSEIYNGHLNVFYLCEMKTGALVIFRCSAFILQKGRSDAGRIVFVTIDIPPAYRQDIWLPDWIRNGLLVKKNFLTTQRTGGRYARICSFPGAFRSYGERSRWYEVSYFMR